jgi:hypothetical protein
MPSQQSSQQQWPLSQVDARTFGQQQSRALDDLNRPTLGGIVTSYLQESMRYWQRKPFFFSDTDNTTPLQWTASVQTTLGTTIQVLVANVTYNFVAANAGLTGTTQPNFASVVGTLFTVPPGNSIPPPPPGTAGTIVDNAVTWMNAGPLLGGFGRNTQLTTVYRVNQYVPPIDLVAFTRVECTWASLTRVELDPLSYEQLRNLDVIGPTPPTTYPTKYCWYQGQFYIWPYAIGLYPLTISYRSAPPIATQANDVNYWTTQGEALVRYYAEGRIQEIIIGDQAMAQMCYARAADEYLVLQQQGTQQDVRAGIPPSAW